MPRRRPPRSPGRRHRPQRERSVCTEFLRGLVDRGLDGVKLVVSDAHAGLRAAIGRVLQGAAWQRCRVHAKRNLLAVARHQHRTVVSAAVSTIFAQPDAESARAQLRRVVDQLIPIELAVAERLQSMEDDLVAYTSFPPVHWSKIWSNNPIERLDREAQASHRRRADLPRPRVGDPAGRGVAGRGQRRLVAAPRRDIAEATLTPLTNQEDRLPALPAASRT